MFKELEKYKSSIPLCSELAGLMFAILDASGHNVKPSFHVLSLTASTLAVVRVVTGGHAFTVAAAA